MAAKAMEVMKAMKAQPTKALTMQAGKQRSHTPTRRPTKGTPSASAPKQVLSYHTIMMLHMHGICDMSWGAAGQDAVRQIELGLWAVWAWRIRSYTDHA